MRPAIILDVETREDPTIANSPDWWARFEESLELPGNIKDPMKLEDWRLDKLSKARARMALSARTACIAMIGTSDIDDGPDGAAVFRDRATDAVDRDTEERVLRAFAESLDWRNDLSRDGDPVVVGWHVRRFDVPLVIARCAVHSIELPRWFPTPRSYRERLVDLLDDVYGDGPLSEWGFVMEGQFKEHEGAELLELSLDDLEAHLREDLATTTTLAQRTQWAWRR